MRKASQPYRSIGRPNSGRTSPIDVNREIELDDDSHIGATHAGDIPLWQRDSISLSARARRLIERIKPTIVQVLPFLDHRVTRLAIDDRTLIVDSSGSYRVD